VGRDKLITDGRRHTMYRARFLKLFGLGGLAATLWPDDVVAVGLVDPPDFWRSVRYEYRINEGAWQPFSEVRRDGSGWHIDIPYAELRDEDRMSYRVLWS
jgi:hypothetical protein